MKILNLGAGNRIINGADNHDIIKHREEINLVFDLNVSFLHHPDKMPYWLFQIGNQLGLDLTEIAHNGIYDKIEFISVIEHLEITPIQALNECWHLLKPNGQLVIKYPHYKSETSFHDPTHRWHLTEYSLDYVDPDTQFGKDYSYYTPYKWQIITPVEQRIIKNRNVKMVLIPRK